MMMMTMNKVRLMSEYNPLGNDVAVRGLAFLYRIGCSILVRKIERKEKKSYPSFPFLPHSCLARISFPPIIEISLHLILPCYKEPQESF